MTTTDAFQTVPNFFDTKEQVVSIGKSKVNTNKRYPHFHQIHFTAGDIQQFEQYRDYSNENYCKCDKIEQNTFSEFMEKIETYIDWEKYKNLDESSVDNTFHYLFYKMKKAIFVKIHNNKLKVFLPFSNVDYKNEWSHLVIQPPEFDSLFDYVKYCSSLSGYTLNQHNFNKNVENWYANNGIFRLEYPIPESDGGVGNVKDMLEELCKTRTVPDMEFFINRRDFPVIKRDEKEPYDCIYGDIPLVSHNYKTYSPIFSNVTKSDFADIPFPTWEDWAIVKWKEDNMISQSGRMYNDEFVTNWNEKIPTAVFRGSSTGMGTSFETNSRLLIAKMDSEKVLDKDGIPFLDAGLTDYNTRPRKEKTNSHLSTIDPNKIQLKLKEKLTPSEQSKYKYVINIDGHVSAFRLTYEFHMKSVVFLVESEWKMWYHDFLQENVHYIKVKKDLSDLYEKIRWCKEHDNEAKEIAQNGYDFAKKYLSKNSILDYLQLLLYKTKEQNGSYMYNYISYKDLLIEDEKSEINKLDNIVLDNENLKILNKNQNTEIFIKDNILVKKSSKERETEMIHEAFVGLFGVNKLTKISDNFIYTHGYSDEKLYIDYTQNEGTLQSYISGKNFQIKEFLNIFVNVLLSIKLAQEQIGFVHYDLYDYNILVEKSPSKQRIEFMNGNIYTFERRYKPIIIDYGKSHIIHKGINHGFKDMFEMNSFQDCHTLLISCLYDIIHFRVLDREEMKVLFILAKFLNISRYTNYHFHSITGLKKYLREEKRYSNITNIQNKEYLSQNPEKLIEYIISSFNLKHYIRRGNNIIQTPQIDIQTSVFKNTETLKEALEKYKEIKDIKKITRKYLSIEKCSLNEHKYYSNLISLYNFSKIYIHVNIKELENSLEKTCCKNDKMIEKLKEYKKLKELL